MTISLAEIHALVDQFERSTWRRITLVADGVQLSLSKDPVEAGSEPEAAPLPSKAATPQTKAAPAAATGRLVTAPSLGTFYRSPRPGTAPFVELGSRVAAGDEICLIEVMKLFTTVRVPCAGVVSAIHAEDGTLVEFDQALISIDPDD